MAAIAAPVACPVVPPGNGKLNIMMTNENAANTDNMGTIRELSMRLTRLPAMYQNGAAAA
jgi:hypothetical protein